MGDPITSRALPVTRATDVFTDRVPLSQAYGAALRRHGDRIAQGLVGADGRRHNLVFFYGAGGIGKTELLRRLERWTIGDQAVAGLWGPAPLPGPRTITSRFDLEDAWDVDRLLLSLRAAAASAELRTRAFDVGLVARWESYRPGEALPQFLDRGPQIGPIALGDAIKEGASAALRQMGLPLGAGMIADLVTRPLLREVRRRVRDRTIADCEALPEVLQFLAERNERSATALGLLLDWDLGEATPEPPAWVVFVDSYQCVKAAEQPVETLIQRLVFSTPRLLWVMAGNEKLDWNDGPLGGQWPDLAPTAEDPAQHLVGDLSDADADHFLQEALSGPDGSPLLDADCRRKIIDAADGMPLYLDLAVDDARRIAGEGRPLAPASFGGPLADMVTRVAGDLPADERRALNAAALMHTFDADLVAAGASVDAATADRLSRRSLVTRADAGSDVHRLHDPVRRAIRAAPTTRGGWTEEDWRSAGQRMLDVLNQRREATTDAETTLAASLPAFDIAAELSLRIPWVLTALLKQPRREQIAVQLATRKPLDAAGWAASLERFFACWLHHDVKPLDEQLAALAADPDTAPDVARVAVRFRAYRLRTLGRHGEAEALFAGLRRTAGGDTGLHRFQHGLTLVALGRFREADHLRSLLDAAGKVSWADRLAGEIALQHGHIDAAIAATTRRAEHAETIVDLRNAMELRVAEARRRALLGREALDRVQAAVDLTRSQLALGHLRSVLCSKALCYAGDRDAVDALVEEGMDIARRADEAAVTANEVLAWTLDAAVRDDRDRVVELRHMLTTGERATDARWIRPIDWWQAWILGEQAPDRGDDWMEPEETVRDRWIALVRRRRASVR